MRKSRMVMIGATLVGSSLLAAKYFDAGLGVHGLGVGGAAPETPTLMLTPPTGQPPESDRPNNPSPPATY